MVCSMPCLHTDLPFVHDQLWVPDSCLKVLKPAEHLLGERSASESTSAAFKLSKKENVKLLCNTSPVLDSFKVAKELSALDGIQAIVCQIPSIGL